MSVIRLIEDVRKAMIETFSTKGRIYVAMLLGIIMLGIAISIPVLMTPGNSLGLHLSLLGLGDFLIALLFASLFSISLTMQFHILRLQKRIGMSMGKGASSGALSFMGALFAANICPACLITIMGLFGIGGASALAVISYTSEILLATMLLMSLMIVMTSRRLIKIKQGNCCSIRK